MPVFLSVVGPTGGADGRTRVVVAGQHAAQSGLFRGCPIESVSRVLGHTNIVTTQIYAKITTQKLDNDLSMFGNKLNASFGSVTP